MNPDDAAFPSSHGWIHEHEYGLTKRELLAGLIAAAIFSRKPDSSLPVDDRADLAVNAADALIKRLGESE